MVNHPAHILEEEEEGGFSLSSFIPFCQLGEDMAVMGRKVPQFSKAVCSEFVETVLEGQVCYQVDVNKYRDSIDWRGSMEFGLGFLIDTNDELDSKQFYPNKIRAKDSANGSESNLRSYVKLEDSSKVKIYLHTLEPIVLYGGGNYAMTGVKYLSVSPHFLQLDQHTRKCQAEESLESCRNRKYEEQVISRCGCLPFTLQHLTNRTEATCSPSQLDCVTSVSVEEDSCLTECEGLVVDVVKTDNEIDSSPSLAELYREYERFKALNMTGLDYSGYVEDLEFKTHLEFVRIYFESSMYDRIYKDKRAKLVDMLAAFGGTMGLLTGFSLISGLEVLYFILKITINSIRKCWN